MPDWKEWREAMDDEEFWTRYDYLHDTLPYKEFCKTYECHKASELRKTSSKWSRLALNSPTQGELTIALYKFPKFGESCDGNTEPSLIVILRRCND